MQIFVQVLASIALSSGAAMAADCFGSNTQNVDDYWGMREQMCNNIQCAYQAPCTVTLGSLKLTRENRGSSAGFASCWDATENIIEQCRIGQNQLGSWETSEEYFIFWT